MPPVVEPGALAAADQPTVPIDDELSLRSFDVPDVPSVLEAFRDPDIQRWHLRRFDECAEAEAWIRRTHADWTSETAATWAVQSPEGTVLGRITLYPRLAAGVGEISYWVLPSARRKQVATRATLALVRWAHQRVGLRRIELAHSTLNHGSCGVADRAGFRSEGTKRSALLHADGWHDMHLHSHLATDRDPSLAPPRPRHRRPG